MVVARLRIVPAAALGPRLDELRAQAGVPAAFPPEVEEEAAAAAARPPEGERDDVPLITVDPPGARDLDQALHLERRPEGGYRVRYAIADLTAWIAPGGAIDREAHARGVTVYAPDRRTPLHPPALSEGAASLLPDQWTPTVLWSFALDADGRLESTQLARRLVRSRAQHTYDDLPADVHELLEAVGTRRLALQRERGGVQLAVPEQEVAERDGGWVTRFRPEAPTEQWNAQLSLLTGIAAAGLMLKAGVGILRTQPDPDLKALARLRRQATALGTPWPEDEPYASFIARLDAADPHHAALLREATGVGRGAGYTAFDGAPPEVRTHFALATEYAHATAPLRRLQDRHVLACCLAASQGEPPPDWVRQALPGLPATMAAAARKAGAVDRGVVDLVEALQLQGREGEVFTATVVDEDLIQLSEPAVRAKLAGAPPPGASLAVRLDRADPASRTVAFSAVGPEVADGHGG